MEQRQLKGEAMDQAEMTKRTLEIFRDWVDKPTVEKVKLLKTQMNIWKGSTKVYLQMKHTIYGCVQAARAFLMELQEAF
jgi:hypothetical protein